MMRGHRESVEDDPKAVASGYGSKPDRSACGGLADSCHVEIIVRLRRRLVLDVFRHTSSVTLPLLATQ